MPRRATAILVLAMPLPADPPGPPVSTTPPAASATDGARRPDPLVAWWTNGTQTLQIREDGSYRLWKSAGRHRDPDETGRWTRQDAATFWLEPPGRRKEDRSRGALSILDGTPVAAIRTFPPLVRHDGPPPAPEDALVGLWIGDGGGLELQDDGRYRFVAPRTGDRSIVHEGRWRLSEDRVTLTPQDPTAAPISLQVTAADGDASSSGTPRPPILRSAEGPLERIQPRSVSVPPPAAGDAGR